MTFLEMAKLTLEKACVPLTVDEIWNKGLEYGFAQQVMTTGKTPARTIGAQLYVNIRDNTKSGFCAVSKRPTRFALTAWDKKELECEPIEVEDKKTSYVYLERELHQILAYFAYNYMNILTRTINDKISKGGPKGKNEWIHPTVSNSRWANKGYLVCAEIVHGLGTPKIHNKEADQML
ncbi:HTH domain-containing protein [Desulfosporosinus sp. SB140]|uniref:HTH domain-containing protein n=1 Tax=Desulfosporosinus paludis TaxID=3115649 RepID=UPI00388F89E8